MLERHAVKCTNCYGEFLYDFDFVKEEGVQTVMIDVGCPLCSRPLDFNFLPKNDMYLKSVERVM